MTTHCSLCNAPLPPADPASAACTVCLHRLEQALRHLPGLYVQLHLELPHITARRYRSSAETRLPWRYRNAPVPVRLVLLIHAERCVTAVREWAVYSIPQALPGAPVRAGRLLQDLCLALAADLPSALQTPAQGQLAQAVWDAYTRARQLLHQDEPPRRVDTPCPNCNLRSLQSDWAGDFTCSSCHARWPTLPDNPRAPAPLPAN